MIDQSFVQFDVANERFAIRCSHVAEILPLPALSVPPYCPDVLAGFFDLGGGLVAVLRTARLLGLEAPLQGLYSHLLRLRGADPAVALLVDRVRSIAPIEASNVRPVAEAETFRGCVAGTVTGPRNSIHILEVDRLFAEGERQKLEAFVTAERNLAAAFDTAEG